MTRLKRSALVAAAGLLLMFAALSFHFYAKMKRVETVANMQTVSAKIEQIRERSGKVTSGDVEGALRAVNHGRDAWNMPLIYRVRPDGDYVLVSAGVNRHLDVHDVGDYAKRASLDTGDDIVFRNGQQITNAGK